jgi:hypothetical protein
MCLEIIVHDAMSRGNWRKGEMVVGGGNGFLVVIALRPLIRLQR